MLSILAENHFLTRGVERQESLVIVEELPWSSIDNAILIENVLEAREIIVDHILG